MESIEFFFDPICPWAWISSRWVEELVDQGEVKCTWRFISLRELNAGKDYALNFPPRYPEIHGLGHKLLRVAALARDEGGNEAVARFYSAAGREIHTNSNRETYLNGGSIEPILRAADLPKSMEEAMEEDRFDSTIKEETELALSRTGRDVGTPIISLSGHEDVSFFGPVMSSIPKGDDALRLFEAYKTFASFPGFAEVKRSLRFPPSFL